MDASLTRIYVALGAAATGTNISWVSGAPAALNSAVLRGRWVMILSIAAAATTYYWDRTGQITPERLTVARAAAGLSLALMANNWRLISNAAGAAPSIAFWVTVVCASASLGLLMLQHR